MTLTDLAIELFVVELRAEVNDAARKFPSPDGLMCALTEEVGELAKAMMDESRLRVRLEAIQVAAMACRVAIEGDPTLDAIRVKRGADAP